MVLSIALSVLRELKKRVVERCIVEAGGSVEWRRLSRRERRRRLQREIGYIGYRIARGL